MKRNYEDIPNSAIVHIIDEYVHSERDRAVMKRYLCDSLSMFQIADEMDISFKTVQRIVVRLEPKIFSRLR